VTEQIKENRNMQIVDAQIHVWGSGMPGNQAQWQTPD